MGGIVWLASYPKSGNTWLRVFLANLLNKGEGPVDINNLSIKRAASSRRIFDETLGVESSDMTKEEVERSRPLCYRRLATASTGVTYLKVHDAYVYTQSGEPLIPAEATTRAVYLIRNPLDVAVSFAHHMSKTVDTTISCMADQNFAFSSHDDRLFEHLEQRLLSWTGHVLSWIDQPSIPVYVMRYEDMLRDPFPTFSGCLEFLGVRATRSEIDRALSFSSFSAMRAQEQASGFRERPTAAKAFFRNGRAGDWRNNLTKQQVDLIMSQHHAVMRRVGYVAEDGSIPE